MFTVSSVTWVNQAGVFDYGSDGLAGSRLVGVWADGVLVDTATVAAGTVDPLLNGFRWTTLTTPLTLIPTVSYVIGADYSGAGISDYFMTSATTLSPFVYVGDADSNPNNDAGHGGVLEFPSGTDSTTGLWGPNLRSVPDGGMTIALLGGALMGLAALRRKLFC